MLKISKPFLMTALFLSSAVASLHAQDEPSGPPPGEGPPPGRRPMPPPLLAALDTDGIILTGDEIAAAPESLLTLDKDGNGELSHEELFPLPPPPSDDDRRPPKRKRERRPDGKKGAKDSKRPQRDGHQPPPMPVMKALDTDEDGKLSKEEIDKSPESLLTLDKNNDGKLSRSELMPPPPGEDSKDEPTDGSSPTPSPIPTPTP